jgi:hypothetical protein
LHRLVAGGARYLTGCRATVVAGASVDVGWMLACLLTAATVENCACNDAK